MIKEKEKFSIEDARYTLDRTTELLNNCDSKTSIALGFIGVVIGLLITNSLFEKAISIIMNNIHLLKFKVYICLMTILVVIFLLGIFMLFSVLFAKFQKSKYDSKIFFTDIANNESIEKFKKKVLNQNEKDLIDDLINQIYINADICTKNIRNIV